MKATIKSSQSQPQTMLTKCLCNEASKLIGAIFCGILAGCGNATIPPEIRNAPEKISIPYTTIDVEETYRGDFVIAKYGVERPLSENALRNISQTLVKQFIKKRPRKGIELFFHLHESDPERTPRAGRAVWLKNGEYPDSHDGVLGDYSLYKLTLYPEELIDDNEWVQRIPVEQRRKIYWDSTLSEDKFGMSAGREIVAAKHNLSLDEQRTISVEGLLKSWPMPPDTQSKMSDSELIADENRKNTLGDKYFREKDSRTHALKKSSSMPALHERDPSSAEYPIDSFGVVGQFSSVRDSLSGRLNDEQRFALKRIIRQFQGTEQALLADEELVADGKVVLALQYAEKISKAKAIQQMKDVVEKYPKTVSATVARTWLEVNE